MAAPLAVIRNSAALREALAPERRAGRRIALVPTMGALHAGHLSLVALAREAADTVVASLFVNPRQFGPKEDFAAYPRDEEADRKKLAAAGCDLLYAPDAAAMYPPGFATTVRVAGVGEDLEGAIRPDHFEGVATIVAKLLAQCAPDVAVFGEKDYQQLLLIRRLAADLDLPGRIVAGPTVRDADGLALSSRNAYLDPLQRRIAPALHASLREAGRSLARGRTVAQVEAEGARVLIDGGFDRVDYFAVRDAQRLEPLGPGPLAGRPARIVAAARLGATRLIDNIAS